LIEPPTLVLDSAVHWRSLLYYATERGKLRLQTFPADLRGVFLPGSPTGGVTGISGYPQFDLSSISLGGVYQKFNNPGPLAQTDRQDSCSLRVKGAGMSHPLLSGQPSDLGDDTE
jgi:hypothetical protein